ncbi:ZEP, partial [Symbiodinium pilosum]
MSRPATEDSQYVWGDVPADFITEGGIYSLCWCPGMHGILCDDFAQYQLSAGELTVLGPRHDHNFRCVRGQDCGSSNLRPLQGLGLSLTDRVSIRSGGCGAARTIQISLANLHGIANVTESVNASSTQGSNTSILGLSFGASDFTLGLDHRLSIDASVVGYDLCWCGLASCAVGDFVVPLGQLIVQGARTNQELRCPVGQECSLSSILTVDPQPGDRLMVLTACATGVSVKGFPGGGVAEHDGLGFEFLASNDSRVLQSPVGIFRLCFCRPQLGLVACDAPADFPAAVGLMVSQGPFDETTACNVGDLCVITLFGIW